MPIDGGETHDLASSSPASQSDHHSRIFGAVISPPQPPEPDGWIVARSVAGWASFGGWEKLIPARGFWSCQR
jgi:hypothetical protein